MATLLLSVMGHSPRQRGAYRGRARALNAEQVEQLRGRAADAIPKATLAREFGISRETVYQYLHASSWS